MIRALHEPRTADPRILAVLGGAAVVDEIQVAVGQLGKADRMLVCIRELGPKDAFVTNLVSGVNRPAGDDRQPEAHTECQ